MAGIKDQSATDQDRSFRTCEFRPQSCTWPRQSQPTFALKCSPCPSHCCAKSLLCSDGHFNLARTGLQKGMNGQNHANPIWLGHQEAIYCTDSVSRLDRFK